MEFQRTESLEQFGAAWETYRARTAVPHEAMLYPVLRDALGDLRGLRVMDLGCGDGTFASLLATDDPMSVVLLDINRMLLRLADRQSQSSWLCVQADLARSVPLPDASVDRAVSSCVLMHLNNPELFQLSCELERVLSPNGKAVVSVVHYEWAERMYSLERNGNGVASMVRKEDGVEFREFYRPSNFYRAIFEEAGLKVAKNEAVKISPAPRLSERYAENLGKALFDVFILESLR